MADTSKITLGQLKTALTQAKNYTDNEIASVTGVSRVEPEELDMPKVFFYGNALPTTKDNVNLTMDYVSNTAKFSSFVKLKCQGTSSMSYAKKNFTVTMYSDEARSTKLKKDFKGWGAQSKFCLKANYVDTTHTRNISGARIAYDMVASRPDSAFKQQLLQCPRNGAVDGFPIKLYFNGEFYGIYTWNIPKDGWMFNMDKNNPNHVVLCAEKNTDGNSSAINSCQFRQLWTNGDGQDWSVEVGTMSEDLRTKFNRVINFVMTSTDQEFHDNIGEYFDLYSLLDYYCFSYLCCHLDGLAKNMLMVTYDGVIWGACLYDMDSIYGVHWNGNSYVATNYQCPEQYQEQFSLLWQRIERCFGAELYARYLELRQGALSLSNIIKHVEEIYDVIPDRVFADEKAKWTSLPQVNTNTMSRFRNYMRDRAAYVDAEMKAIGANVPCTGIVLSVDTLSFTTTDTQTLEAVVSPSNTTNTIVWSVEPVGIATVDNGVVTPIANGTCTITATCGSYSDTCTVTVSLPVVECTGITLDKHELVLSLSSSEETIDITQNITNGSLIRGNWAVNDNRGIFGNVSTNANDRTTDFIPFTSNDTLTISQPSSKYGCGLVAYDSNKQALVCYTANNAWEAGDTQSTIDLTSLTVNVAAPPSDTAYVRISFNLKDLSGVTVVKKYTNNSVSSYQLTATVTPENCTQPVIWSVDPTGIVTVDNGLVIAVANGGATVTATCGTQSATCAVTVSGMSESGGGSDVNTNLVFQVNSASMNTTDNTLTDNIAGISATLTGNPTVNDNQIAFTASDTFSFDISSLNLTSSNRTFRIKFTPTTLDSNNKNVMGLGEYNYSWIDMTTAYINSTKLMIQHGNKGFTGITTGSGAGNNSNNRLPAAPITGQEYELVISESTDGNVRWYIDGALVQDGTAELINPLCISNTEGTNRFIGSYSLIEIYNVYCNDYTEFTNIVNNASSGEGTDISDGYMSYMIQYQSEPNVTFALHSPSTSTDCQGFECSPSFNGFAFPTSTTDTDTSYMICDSLPTVTDSEKKVNNIPCIAGAYSSPKNYLTVKVLKTNASTTDEFKTYFRENPTYIKIKVKDTVHKYRIDINNVEMLTTSHTMDGYTCGEFIANDLPVTNYTAANVFMSNLGFSDDWKTYDWSYFRIGEWQGNIYVGFQIKNELLETQDLEGIRKYIAKDPNIYYIN